jgi:hypothetical protein
MFVECLAAAVFLNKREKNLFTTFYGKFMCEEIILLALDIFFEKRNVKM